MNQKGLDIRERQRIPCPRCGANNFPGQVRCWQCGASLPPPEEIGAASAPATPPRGSVPPPVPTRPSRRSRTGLWVLLAAALILACAIPLFLRSVRTGAARSASEQAELQRLRQQMLRGDELPGSQPAEPLEQNSVEARARRELDRLRQEAGLANPPADSSGQVHLQTGGSLSADEWQRAQRALTRP